MHDSLEQSRADVHRSELPRPAPPRQLGELAHEWLAWFGVARMLALGVTVLLVGAGGYWLLHAPPPPVEASLPFAATTTTATTSTVAGAEPGAGAPTGRHSRADQSAKHCSVAGIRARRWGCERPGRVSTAVWVASHQLHRSCRRCCAKCSARWPQPRSASGRRTACVRAAGGRGDPTTVDNGPAARSSVLGGWLGINGFRSRARSSM